MPIKRCTDSRKGYENECTVGLSFVSRISLSFRRSDGGERAKNRAPQSPLVFFPSCFFLRSPRTIELASHYLNAWNRLKYNMYRLRVTDVNTDFFTFNTVLFIYSDRCGTKIESCGLYIFAL